MVVDFELEGKSADCYDGDTEVIEIREVEKVIDGIEEKVRLALEYIDSIKGIKDIDRCKKALNEIIDGIG